MSDIGERVKKIVVEHLGVEAEKVTEGASFIDDLGADSLDTVELVMAFEEEFGCEIPDDAAETILTVGDAVKFLETTPRADRELALRRGGASRDALPGRITSRDAADAGFRSRPGDMLRCAVADLGKCRCRPLRGDNVAGEPAGRFLSAGSCAKCRRLLDPGRPGCE